MDKAMARRYQQVRTFLPGLVAVLFVSSIVFTALIALWLFAFKHGDDSAYFDSYLWQILFFTVIQAAASALMSIILGALLAKSIYHSPLLGKAWLLRLLSLTFILPSLVVVMGLLSVYGNHGWISTLCLYFDIDYSWSIYGINGIILAHLFLNFPLATRYSYQALLLIPNEQRQLSEQLGLNGLQIFRYIELPILIKHLLPLAGLIFMLCFSSFAIVLALSGGPKYTTIEVAIYQAIRDFELYQAVILSFIQFIFCLGFMIVLKRLEPKHAPLLVNSKNPYIAAITRWQYGINMGFIGLCLLFIATPLLAIVIDGIRHFSFLFFSPALIQALMTSILVAICSAIVAMVLAVSLLSTNSRLQLMGKKRLSEGLMLIGSLILAIPSMVLAAGFFILFYYLTDTTWLIYCLVIISNSFLALPFILKQLAVPLSDLTKQYYFLSQSLNIQGINYLYFIEFGALKRLFLSSFAFACIMSMGDFGIIALFGSQDFITLPYYLYDLISRYHFQEASFIALLLLFISFLFITLVEYVNHD